MTESAQHTLQSKKSTPGYQGSHTNGVEVSVYSHADDPILKKKRNARIDFVGYANRPDASSVVSVDVDKSFGSAAGSFTIVVKDTAGLIESLADDDWIDITFIVDGGRYHVLRGILDTFRESEITSGSGATTKTLTLVGRDFGAIFDKTKIWFNQFRNENAGFAKTIPIFESLNAVGSPTDAVSRIIFGFMETLATADPPRSNWLMPRSMGLGDITFPEKVLFYDAGFTNDPARYAVDMQLMDPAGVGVWALAQEWADPTFCELYCDLLVVNEEKTFPQYLKPGQQSTPQETIPAIIFRDRPFPTERDGINGPWFKLPLATISKQDIVARNIGRGGQERYNAFFVSPRAIQQLNASGLDLCGPLWDVESVARHGMRDYNVDSRYICEESSLGTMSVIQRQLARDFHGLNPYFTNGSLSLGILRPDIRIGVRTRILGATEEDNETFYTEQISHSWRLTSSRTTIGVTRGWIGTDISLQEAVYEMALRYTVLPGDDVPEEPSKNLPQRRLGSNDIPA